MIGLALLGWSLGWSLGVSLGSNEAEWIEVALLIPDAVIDVRYATANNVTHKQLYTDGRCVLRAAAAKKLVEAAARLRQHQRRLVLWDCYRPHPVQFELWTVFPHRGFVAPPKQGSLHNRGVAVDLALVALDGSPVPLPTDFDDFTPRAHHDAKLPAEAATERALLRAAMIAAGFRRNDKEWWHYELPDGKSYALEARQPKELTASTGR